MERERSLSFSGRLRSIRCAVRGIGVMLPIAGRAKDVAASAVLIAALGSVAIGLLVLGPHCLAWLAR